MLTRVGVDNVNAKSLFASCPYVFASNNKIIASTSPNIYLCIIRIFLLHGLTVKNYNNFKKMK
jgi:hypothetical protein